MRCFECVFDAGANNDDHGKPRAGLQVVYVFRAADLGTLLRWLAQTGLEPTAIHPCGADGTDGTKVGMAVEAEGDPGYVVL